MPPDIFVISAQIRGAADLCILRIKKEPFRALRFCQVPLGLAMFRWQQPQPPLQRLALPVRG